MVDILNADRAHAAPVAVVGAGNWLIASDRAGPRVLERIRGRYGPEVEIRNMGSAGLALLDHLHGQELMCLVDACLGSGPPGRVHVSELRFDGMPDPVASVHQIGPLETLAIAARLYPGDMPKRAVLIGIETEGIDERMEELACEEAVAILDREIERWRSTREASAAERFQV
jgi:hydrogenase maturation protease